MPDIGQKPACAMPAPRVVARDLGLVVLVAVAFFGWGVAAEPHFADESAYLSQSYYADLWLEDARDSAAWLDYPAYDLPPLPKYAIGLALRLGGYPRPGPWAARAWYADIHRRFDAGRELVVARCPSVLFGALGCAAIYGLGLPMAGRSAGLLAALLLMANPLYRLHARRAMSDVPAEALLLASTALGLWAWRRFLAGRSTPATWLLVILSGACGGLATLSKLNGALALMVLAAWAVLAAGLPVVSPGRKAAVTLAAVVAGLVSLATFLVLNPFLTAHPRPPVAPGVRELADLPIAGRARWLVEHRMSVSRGQQDHFPHNAVRSPSEKLAAVAVQGFGRFGPLGPGHSDSRRRFDPEQDWGLLVWWPCVLLGAAWSVRRGRRQFADGEPPAAWAILVQSALAALVVTAYLPLAWDRYFLSIQPGAALLASGVLVAALGRLARGRGAGEAGS